jgi:putative transposase
VKRSLRVEADGGPLAAVITPANRHDTKLLAATLDAIVVERPAPTPKAPQHLCLDKAYDNPTGHTTVAHYGYCPHIRRIGEEKLDLQGEKRFPARRWVVERTLSWLSNAGPCWCAMTRTLTTISPCSNSLVPYSGSVGFTAFLF